MLWLGTADFDLQHTTPVEVHQTQARRVCITYIAPRAQSVRASVQLHSVSGISAAGKQTGSWTPPCAVLAVLMWLTCAKLKTTWHQRLVRFCSPSGSTAYRLQYAGDITCMLWFC